MSSLRRGIKFRLTSDKTAPSETENRAGAEKARAAEESRIRGGNESGVESRERGDTQDDSEICLNT